MGGRTSKSRARPSHLELSKASQGKVPEAVAGKGIGMYIRSAFVSGELGDMLTCQVQSFHQITESSLKWVETSRNVRWP